jgi:crossover junction endodeoxyribonuclease RusA
MISSLKSAMDGIAQALGVDDHRFRPHYVFAEPDAPGRVEVQL